MKKSFISPGELLSGIADDKSTQRGEPCKPRNKRDRGVRNATASLCAGPPGNGVLRHIPKKALAMLVCFNKIMCENLDLATRNSAPNCLRLRLKAIRIV